MARIVSPTTWCEGGATPTPCTAADDLSEKEAGTAQTRSFEKVAPVSMSCQTKEEFVDFLFKEGDHKQVEDVALMMEPGPTVMPVSSTDISTGPNLIFRMGSTPASLRSVLLGMGWREWSSNTFHEHQWNLWWKSGRFKPTEYKTPHQFQRMNHFPKSSMITKKDSLLRALRKAHKVYGNVYNFWPESFILPGEYTKFVHRWSEEEKPGLWICKPDGAAQGRGIFLINDLGDLKYETQYIVQRYIERPLLVGGYKMDLRIYVVVRSFRPLRAYIYRNGLARFGTEKYEANVTDLSNQYSHLTNSSINKFSKSFSSEKEVIGAGCKWSFDQLKAWFTEHSLEWNSMWGRTRNLITLTLLTAMKSVPIKPHCFEMFGFDVLLDDNLVPSLIEVNCSPALGIAEPADTSVKIPLLKELVRLIDCKPLTTEMLTSVSHSKHPKRSIISAKGNRTCQDVTNLATKGKPKRFLRRGSHTNKGTMPQSQTADETVAPRKLHDYPLVPSTNYEMLFPFDQESTELTEKLATTENDKELQALERSIVAMLRIQQRLFKQEQKQARVERGGEAVAKRGHNDSNHLKGKLATAKQIDTFLNGS